MRKVLLLILLVALAGGAGLSRNAIAQMSDARMQPATESATLLKAWNGIGDKLIAQAEDFPEDKYDFKPTPEVRSFAQVALHVSGSMYNFTDGVEGKKGRYAEDPDRTNLMTKAQIVAFVKKAVADGANAIQTQGDAGLAKVIKDWSMPASDVAYAIIEHSGEHYGQLVVYYRLNGLVPPSSR